MHRTFAALAVSLLVPALTQAAIPLARRLTDTRLARDFVKAGDSPALVPLETGGDEVPATILVEAGGALPSPERWGADRFELVRARSGAGDESLLAFDHRARRWWRLAATRADLGPLEARRSADGRALLVRAFLGVRPTFSAYLLGEHEPERLARFQVPWGELDRDLLRRVREGGLAVTSPDTEVVAFTELAPLEVGPDGPLVKLRGTAYLGRRDAFRQALVQADPTLGLTAREIFLTRDWIPPGAMPVVLRIEKERVWVAGVGPLDERDWVDPVPGPACWVLPRPR